MSIQAALSRLKTITAQEQVRGTGKLATAGIEYDDGTIQGVIDNINPTAANIPAYSIAQVDENIIFAEEYENV